MVTSRHIREVLIESGEVSEATSDSGVIGVLMGILISSNNLHLLEKWYDARRAELDNQRVCVYCLGTWASNTFVCPTCEEYDGMVDYKTAMAEGALSL